MTRQSFYRALRKTAERHQFFLAKGGKIRCKVQGGKYCCPITAVHYDKTKELITIANVQDTALLDDADGNLVTVAADNLTRAKTYRFEKNVRKALLRNCGLVETN